MENFEPLVSFAVALGAGLLIGLQREQSAAHQDHPGGSSGGIRTFPIISLAGGLSVMIAEKLSPWIFAAAFVVVFSPVVISYYFQLQSGGERGVKTEAAFAVTFLLGALALTSRMPYPPAHRLLIVGALAVATTALLSLKEPLHELASRVSREDLYSTVKFLVLAVIILPLLPNQEFFKLINPFTIGLMVVLLAGVGFAAYVAIRLVGPGRGLGLTGLIGGLISSTAVTLSVAGHVRKSSALARPGALAVVLASTVMIARMAILISATNQALLGRSAGMLAAMAAAGAVGSFLLYEFSRGEPGTGEAAVEVPFHNPFELLQAFKFALLFTSVLVASKLATHYLGGAGAYLAAAVGGLADVDPVTLSLSHLSGPAISPETARAAIWLGAVSNSVVKAGMATVLGGWKFGKWVWAVLALSMAAGAAFAFSR